MHHELVERRRWIDSEHFFHALSHCMLLPGPEAQQLAIYLGWKLHGLKGGIIAGALFVIPSTFVLLLLSILYGRFGNLPWMAAIFLGLKPAVLALVFVALFRVTKRSLATTAQWVVATSAFAAIVWWHASIPVVMLAVVVLGLLQVRFLPRIKSPVLPDAEVNLKDAGWVTVLSRVAKVFAAGFVLWHIPLAALYAFGRDRGFWTQLSFFFTRTAFVTLGGSYTVIPYVAHVAVMKYHWLGQSEMLDGFALAETTPGPLIIVVAFVGFMAAFHHAHSSVAMGTVGLLVTTFYTFLPCFLFVLAGAPLVEKSQNNGALKGFLQLIMAVVIAAMLDLAVVLSRGVLFTVGRSGSAGMDWAALAQVGVSLIMLTRTKINLAAMLGLSICFGFGRWFLLG